MSERTSDVVKCGLLQCANPIYEVRNTWQLYRDRRPDAYDELHRRS